MTAKKFPKKRVRPNDDAYTDRQMRRMLEQAKRDAARTQRRLAKGKKPVRSKDKIPSGSKSGCAVTAVVAGTTLASAIATWRGLA